MKKAYILLTTSFILIFISLTIGAYIKFSANITSQEFQKDLATIRGYWAVYGAKELQNAYSFPYHSLDGSRLVYEINATKDGSGASTRYNWAIIQRNTSISNDDVYRRTLRTHTYVQFVPPFSLVRVYDPNQMNSYKMEDN